MKSKLSFDMGMRAALVALIAFASSGAAARADDGPPGPPPEAPPSYAHGEESVRGRIASIDGKYNLTVRDDRGYVDSITLHDGTVINPRGLRLAPGQAVTIYGHNAGRTFAANEIDTPYYRRRFYPYAYPAPYYPYYPYAAIGVGVGYRSPGFAFRGWF